MEDRKILPSLDCKSCWCTCLKWLNMWKEWVEDFKARHICYHQYLSKSECLLLKARCIKVITGEPLWWSRVRERSSSTDNKEGKPRKSKSQRVRKGRRYGWVTRGWGEGLIFIPRVIQNIKNELHWGNLPLFPTTSVLNSSILREGNIEKGEEGGGARYCRAVIFHL